MGNQNSLLTAKKMHANLKVSDAIAETFKAVKLKRAHPWMFVALNDDHTEVVVHSTGNKGDAEEAWFADLAEKTGQKPGIIIIDHNNKLWKFYKCFDSLPVKEKMPT